LERRLKKPVKWRYDTQHRLGDHICYITNLSKWVRDYPQWRITYSLTDIVDEILEAEGADKRTVILSSRPESSAAV
jgi:CDP-paratose 2-epimerase